MDALQVGKEACYDVWFENSGTNKMSESGHGSGRTEGTKILLSMTRTDWITSEYITGMPQVEWFGDKGAEARLRSFGYVQRKDSGYSRQRMVKRELPSGRKRGTSREELWL